MDHVPDLHDVELIASRLLRYAERQYGEQVSPPLPPEELPPRVKALVEELRNEFMTTIKEGGGDYCRHRD